MTTYTIKICYKTGDSFNSYETEDEVGMQWEDLSKAKQALQWIAEHYKAYQDDDLCYGPNKFDVVNSIKDKPWFDGNNHSWDWKYGMYVEKDDGQMQRICSFWCGYFERLLEAEIIVCQAEDDGMKISF